MLGNVVESQNLKISCLEGKVRSIEVNNLKLNCDSELHQESSFQEQTKKTILSLMMSHQLQKLGNVN